MLEMKMSVDLASPADKVWELTGNFNGLPDSFVAMSSPS